MIIWIVKIIRTSWMLNVNIDYATYSYKQKRNNFYDRLAKSIDLLM